MNAKIGIITVSDRASVGAYKDEGGPALEAWFNEYLATAYSIETQIIADEQDLIEAALIHLCDEIHCDLIVTTGGTGPAKRDVTPEATEAICDKIMPGFGEQMRQISLQYVPTAILSRQTAGVRGKTLIINLPGRPKSIAETLDGLFPAIPYCIDIIGGAWIDTKPEKMTVFRPKNKK